MPLYMVVPSSPVPDDAVFTTNTVEAKNEECARWAALEAWGLDPDVYDPDRVGVYLASRPEPLCGDRL